MIRITPLNDSWVFSCVRWQQAPGKPDDSIHEFRPATVPGQVHLDLVNEGVISDPFQRCYERGCEWVDDEDWIYRRPFEFTADAALPRRILRFEGLDTICRVFLNERLVAESDNMYVPLEVDVTDSLVEGTNQLRIQFYAARRVGEERRAQYFEAHGIPSDTVRFDARAFVRKAQYMFGWDWGPSLISAGIYRPVSLIEHAGRIRDVHVEQRHDDCGKVAIRFSSELEGHDGSVTPSAQNPPEAGLVIYHFVEGVDAPVRDGQWLEITEPRLWWPHGMGRPELYEVVSVLCVDEPRSRIDTTSSLDVKRSRIGLRQIELVQEPDVYGKSFRFRINGREMYALGANYIPDDSFTSRLEPSRLRAQLERAVDLGMNLLRVWGGGFYETDAFYDGCDELGLLVWQDFPYACSYYPDDASTCERARNEARASIIRLRNHPSLALWCGNNENDTMRDSKWDDATRHPLRYEGDRIYREVLPQVLAELDSARPYIPSSPFGDGQANDGGTGDQHYWDVWHGRGDYPNYSDSTARFCSEFGFAAAPGHATWRAIDPTRNLLNADVRDPIARWHDKTAKGYETFLGFVELHYPSSRTVEEWIYRSQLNQRDALRFGIEHFRRSKFCRGTLIWQLNDCWPVQSWSVIDSSFQYKAAAFELRRLYAPLLTSLERAGQTVRLWGILDNVESSVNVDAVLALRRLSDGAVISSKTSSARLEPGDRRVLLELEVENASSNDCVVWARVGEQESTLLLAEPKELSLTASPLIVEVSAEYLSVVSSSPLIDLCLWDESGTVTFFDNFLTQLQPGRVVVRYRGKLTQIRARSLGGLHEVTVSVGEP